MVVDQMVVDQMVVDQMVVDQMVVDQMVVDQKICRQNGFRQNVFRSYVAEPEYLGSGVYLCVIECECVWKGRASACVCTKERERLSV